MDMLHIKAWKKINIAGTSVIIRFSKPDYFT